jgi:hypothetical protein
MIRIGRGSAMIRVSERSVMRRGVNLRSRWKRQNQRGFALLLVFLMASAVALMLYMQVPREAFESERDKEQMLIDRGNQYKRAIYLYYISNNQQWPTKLDDLENTNNHRYLRERFVDPYTGKADWRLIHTNGAFLTDSLVTPPPAQGAPGVQGGALAGSTGAPTPSNGFSLTSPLASTQTPAPNAPPQVNAQVQRHASDLTMVPNSSYQNIAGGAPAAPASNDPGYQPFNPAALPPISLYPNGYNAPPSNAPGGVPGVSQPGVNQPGFNQPGFNQPGVNPAGINVGQNVNQLGGPNPNGVPNPGVPNQSVPNQNGLNSPPVNPFSATNPFVNPNASLNAQGNTGLGDGSQPGITQAGGVNPGAPGAVNLPGTNYPLTNQGFVPPNLPNPLSSFNQPTGGATQPNQSPFGSSSPFSSSSNPFAPQQLPGGNVGAPPGVPGFGGAQGAPGANNQAMNLINNLLTTPRQPPAGIGAGQPTTGGGGLAGVASTYKGTTIKSYGDQTKYQMWEFVFQLNQQGSGLTLQAPQGPNGSGGIPNGGPATPGSPNAPGAPGAASPFPSSTSPGFTMPGSTAPGSTAPGVGGAVPTSPFSSSGTSSGFGSSNSSPFGTTP